MVLEITDVLSAIPILESLPVVTIMFKDTTETVRSYANGIKGFIHIGNEKGYYIIKNGIEQFREWEHLDRMEFIQLVHNTFVKCKFTSVIIKDTVN